MDDIKTAKLIDEQVLIDHLDKIGMTRRQLALRMDVYPSTLYTFLTNGRTTLENVVLICRETGLTPNDFMVGWESPKTEK